jgi:hypothetical protein
MGTGLKFSIRHISSPLYMVKENNAKTLKSVRSYNTMETKNINLELINKYKNENIINCKGYSFCPAPLKAGSKSLIETPILFLHNLA